MPSPPDDSPALPPRTSALGVGPLPPSMSAAFSPGASRTEAILNFWFARPTEADYGRYRKVWFIKDVTFDEQIRQQFLADYEKAATPAAAAAFSTWASESHKTYDQAIARLILLDQFPRNLFRGQPRSFATDAQALAVAQHIVDTGADKALIAAHRFFVYVPFEHSENMAHQNRCVELMAKLIEDVPNLDQGLRGGLDYAIRHRDIIERFGRFPHRNDILGRESTPEEIAFLKQPGSRF